MSMQAPSDTLPGVTDLAAAPTALAMDAASAGLQLPQGLVGEQAFVWPSAPLAYGGMAEIFLAKDKRLGREVILKTPRDGSAPHLTRMFERRVAAEAAILAKLQHPSIVTIYELGKSAAGMPFCVMERVEGRALRDRLDELAVEEASLGKPQTQERLQLLASLIAVAEALAYAHERRVVHRDVTPNNILLGSRNEATLIDWGIARDLDAADTGDAALLGEDPSVSGRMVTISAGTPPYVSLEQSQGRMADPSFDVYSFGVTLYEVIAGKPPFPWTLDAQSGTHAKQLNEFLDWLAAPSAIPPASPKDPELSGIIAKAIHHNPAERFTSDQLLLALRQYLTGDLVFSHRYSPTGRLAAWMRKHRVATVTLGFTALAVVGGTLVMGQLARTARNAAELRLSTQTARTEALEQAQKADHALHEAESAKARADAAERDGQDARALRQLAEAKRREAEAMQQDAESAANKAQRMANAASSRAADAEASRLKAEAARASADEAREAALREKQSAEQAREQARDRELGALREKEAAVIAVATAEREREAAVVARNQAEQARSQAERDAARVQAALTQADRDRQDALAAKSAAEQELTRMRNQFETELTAAMRRIAELEAGGAPTNTPTDAPPATRRRRTRR